MGRKRKGKKKNGGRIKTNTQVCIECGDEEHPDDSLFCRICGHDLHREHDVKD